MTPPATTERYKNHRFPAEIISHGVWLSYRFTLSYRDLQELLYERGVAVSYEAIRQWCRKFGQDYANRLLRPQRPLLSAFAYRQEMRKRFKSWAEMTGTAWAA
jgi:transposase-like protein